MTITVTEGGPDNECNVVVKDIEHDCTAADILEDLLEAGAAGNAVAARAYELANTHPQAGCWWLDDGRTLLLVDG